MLPGAGEGDWVSPHRARLEEARIKLTETEFSARLRLGDAGDAIGELEAAVATYPFQEGLWELLITALYRAGRQADALAAYQRVRNQLADELGLDPGPQLQQLERQILVHDAALGGHPRRAIVRSRPARPGTCRRSSLSSSAGRRKWPPSPTCWAQNGLSRSSGLEASERRPSRSQPVAI